MNILKTASVAVISGLVMVSAASMSARAAMSGTGSVNAEVASVTDPSPAAHVEYNWLMPSAANQRQQPMTCKPGRLYSQHDIVGDPESCIMQGVGFFGGARGSVTGVPGL
jgi:hypothetical protein